MQSFVTLEHKVKELLHRQGLQRNHIYNRVTEGRNDGKAEQDNTIRHVIISSGDLS